MGTSPAILFPSFSSLGGSSPNWPRIVRSKNSDLGIEKYFVLNIKSVKLEFIFALDIAKLGAFDKAIQGVAHIAHVLYYSPSYESDSFQLPSAIQKFPIYNSITVTFPDQIVSTLIQGSDYIWYAMAFEYEDHIARISTPRCHTKISLLREEWGLIAHLAHSNHILESQILRFQLLYSKLCDSFYFLISSLGHSVDSCKFPAL